jgi:hypothetical protein
MLKLIYLSNDSAVIGTLREGAENKFPLPIDKAMLLVIYYDRIPNKTRTGVDYLTTFTMQPLTGTTGPQDITATAGDMIVDCTDERLTKFYEAAIKSASEPISQEAPADNAIPFPK